MDRKHLAQAALIGVGATAVMDLGAEVIRRATGVPPLNYGLVARWIGHMGRGRFSHDSIMAAEPVKDEHELGQIAHYVIGSGFVVALVALDRDWMDEPKLLPAMGMGLATCAAPWLLMQPAWGLGFAASKTPEPRTARLRTVRAHAIYGLGIYLAGKAWQWLR